MKQLPVTADDPVIARGHQESSIGVLSTCPREAPPDTTVDQVVLLPNWKSRRSDETLYRIELAIKRCIDVIGSTILLVLAFPIFCVVAIGVKLDSPGPVLFTQKRLGRGGRVFTLYKFRSMRADAEQLLRGDPHLYRLYVSHDYKLPPEIDPRISPFGRFLRQTSLDELPQLWNVIRGDMSLVGPRPIVEEEIREYGSRAPMLLSMKPGLTGYWQVNGRSNVGYPERVDVELEYVARWSIWLDLEILLKTPAAVLRRDGAH